jgi:FHS family L-fucose permease-like MFS transporter
MNSKNNLGAIISLISLFFIWGFITVMNVILVNSFQGIFNLTATQRSLVQMAFFGAFFIVSLIYFLISSITGKDPINKIGYNNGMIISLIITGLGCISFYPAAELNSYGAFLAALFILATGVTLLQICSNPYATIIGKPETASSRLNLAQGFNSLGTTIGPIIGTILIYKVFSDGVQTVESISLTYVIYGIVFFVLAILVKLAKMPAFTNNDKIEKGISVLKNRHLLLGIFAIFFYVGSEVSIGTWIVEFLKSDKVMSFTESEASYFLSYFWGGLMIGRLMASQSLNKDIKPTVRYISMILISITVFAFIYIATSVKFVDGNFSFEMLSFSKVYYYLIYIILSIFAFIISGSNAAKALVVFSIINIALILTAILSSGTLAMWSILGAGLFFSIGWSNIFSLAIKDLGKYTSQGSSLLVMAIVGGAALPWIQSHIIEAKNVQISFIIPIIGLIYIIFYGLIGHKIKKIA